MNRRDELAEVISRHIEPRAREVDKHARFPRVGLDTLAGAGILGCTVPLGLDGHRPAVPFTAVAVLEAYEPRRSAPVEHGGRGRSGYVRADWTVELAGRSQRAWHAGAPPRPEGLGGRRGRGRQLRMVQRVEWTRELEENL